MIQLATKPNARFVDWRPTPQGEKDKALAGQRMRAGHAWPFLSKEVRRPQAQEEPKNPRSDSGS